MINIYMFGCCLTMLWLYYLWTRRRYYKVAWQLKGPLGLPFVGVGLNMMNSETFLPYTESLASNYKSPFIVWMGSNCFLYVNDPETVESVFNSAHCTNKGDFYRFMSSAIGDGLFTSSSSRWTKHRRLINPAFSRQVINNFLPIFNAEGNVLMDKLAEEGIQTAKEVEIYQILKKVVLETACQTTMGKKMNFQHDSSHTIFKAYNSIMEVCVTRMLSPWLYPDAIYRRSALFMREQKLVNVLFGFVEQLLGNCSSGDRQNRSKSRSRNGSESESERKCQSLVSVQSSADGADKHAKAFVDTSAKWKHPIGDESPANADETEAEGTDGIGQLSSSKPNKAKSIFIEQVRGYISRGQLTWHDVRDEANVTIAATFETTSTALYFTILCLAMHPEYQNKLYDELVELFPAAHANSGDSCNNNINVGGGDNDDGMTSSVDYINVTNEHLERMTYTEMVINEAMRLFAPVPMVLRRADQDFALPVRKASSPHTVTIPRGTQIAIDIYNMHRSESVWGPHARCFRPELHFGSAVENIGNRHPFAFVPFTKGLRMCIGYRYALMLMKVLLAKIFRHYRIGTHATMEDLIIKGTISLKLRDYPRFTIEKR